MAKKRKQVFDFNVLLLLLSLELMSLKLVVVSVFAFLSSWPRLQNNLPTSVVVITSGFPESNDTTRAPSNVDVHSYNNNNPWNCKQLPAMCVSSSDDSPGNYSPTRLQTPLYCSELCCKTFCRLSNLHLYGT